MLPQDKQYPPDAGGALVHPSIAVNEGALAVAPEVALESDLDTERADAMTTMSSEKSKDSETAEEDGDVNVLSSLSRMKKNVLFTCFCLSIFVDGAGTTAMFIMTEPIAKDLDISRANEAWIPSSYAMVFAAFLLLAGRLADLYPPHVVYTVGYFGLGLLYLIISFMSNQYAFFVLRSVCALFATLTIPSSLNMIIQMYPNKLVQAKKLALFGMAGALASTLAPVLVGVFLLASWQWYFRFIAMVAIPFSIFAWYITPKTEAVAQKIAGSEKWKRMDLGGVFLLVSALVLFMVAFTQASSVGWRSASFLAPLLVSLVVLFPAFIFWEQHQEEGHSLLPHDFWRYPNIIILMFLASTSPMWFSTYQLRCAVYFQSALGDSAILAAAKLVPMGAVSVLAGILCQPFPQLIMKPRVVQPVACALAFTGTMLLAFSGGGWGVNYWKFIFPGELFGTFGAMLVFIGMNTAIIQSFPREYAGVGGSVAQVVFQIGGVVGIAIQAGLVSTGDGTVTDWTGDRNGYIFVSVYMLAAGILFAVLYRQPKAEKADEESSVEQASEGSPAEKV